MSNDVQSSPVDPTSTAAWARLTELHGGLKPDLRGWFDADPGRAERFSFTAGDLYVDLSKNLIDDEVLAALVELGEQVRLAERRDAMFSGERINVTENRAVLHTALRDPDNVEVDLDGTNVVPLVHEELAKVYAFADEGPQRRVARGQRQDDRDRGQHRDRRVRPGSGDGLRGATAVRAAGSDRAFRLQHRPHRRGGEDQGPRPRDDARSSSPPRRSPPWRP